MRMAHTKTEDQPSLDKLPDDLAERSRRLVNDAFRILTEQTQQMANDLEAFNRRRSETQERIRRGARRTTRRVV